VTLSEPQSIMDVSIRYQKFGSTPELRELARDVVRIECRPYRSFQPLVYAIKVRGSQAVSMPLFG